MSLLNIAKYFLNKKEKNMQSTNNMKLHSLNQIIEYSKMGDNGFYYTKDGEWKQAEERTVIRKDARSPDYRCLQRTFETYGCNFECSEGLFSKTYTLKKINFEVYTQYKGKISKDLMWLDAIICENEYYSKKNISGDSIEFFSTLNAQIEKIDAYINKFNKTYTNIELKSDHEELVKDELYSTFCTDKRFMLEVIKNDHLTNGLNSMYNLKGYESNKNCLTRDGEFMLEAMKINKNLLAYAHEDLLKDAVFMYGAIKNNPSAVDFMNKSLLKDMDFVIPVLKFAPQCFKDVDPRWQKNIDIVFPALSKNMKCVEYVSSDLLDLGEFYFEVIISDNFTFEQKVELMEFLKKRDSNLFEILKEVVLFNMPERTIVVLDPIGQSTIIPPAPPIPMDKNEEPKFKIAPKKSIVNPFKKDSGFDIGELQRKLAFRKQKEIVVDGGSKKDEAIKENQERINTLKNMFATFLKNQKAKSYKEQIEKMQNSLLGLESDLTTADEQKVGEIADKIRMILIEADKIKKAIK